MAIGRAIVLVWADIMALYTLFIMMVYLTDVWKLGFSHAAAIINVFWGLSLALPLLLKFIVDTISGNFWMLLISSMAYCAGMGFLTMSTPPVLANAMGTCSEYKPECVGEGQKMLFYTALALISLGLSGHLTCFGSFVAEQVIITIDNLFQEMDNMFEQMSDIMNNDNMFRSICCMWFRTLCSAYFVIIMVFAAITAVTYINPWSLRFGIPAICTVAATLIFLTGVCSYKYVKPQGSPITNIFRVFVASATKLFDKCFDKAAIVLPTQPFEEQKKNRWRLCTVTEVEETKTIIRMIPISMTLIMCGVVISIGFTYFVEQVNHLNPKFIFFKVPLPVFLGVYQLAQGVGCSSYQFVQSLANCFCKSRARKYAPSIGMGVSMVLAILCCITAAKVENRRLGVVQKHGLVDKPDERVPMSMFWMLPQFILLGMFYGLLEISTICFFIDQYPVSINSLYLPFVVIGLFGLGILGSVLSVYVVGKVSERGGNMNWFQHNLNGSRVDKYYWTLAWLMAVNLAIFIVVAIIYQYKESETEDEEDDGGEEDEEGGIQEPYSGEVAECCCCCG
ncbi:hypothetical protein BUALT_Bualt09G0123500 [Buddleja alternifolia]|uniref:Uncharacterized protein n=1 Tax=Buddleja alternifolia TaxID=168488 RepID=A0AAV6X3F3_9LAMI|nr:hypothetical protein BUALT_Bualt09G0123500 [Buddleja alternifolia]